MTAMLAAVPPTGAATTGHATRCHEQPRQGPLHQPCGCFPPWCVCRHRMGRRHSASIAARTGPSCPTFTSAHTCIRCTEKLSAARLRPAGTAQGALHATSASPSACVGAVAAISGWCRCVLAPPSPVIGGLLGTQYHQAAPGRRQTPARRDAAEAAPRRAAGTSLRRIQPSPPALTPHRHHAAHKVRRLLLLEMPDQVYTPG